MLTRALEPRRAAVSLIIRVVPNPAAPFPQTPDRVPTLSEFFEQSWVKDPSARPEILFLHREDTTRNDLNQDRTRHNTNEAHVAFPGGRQEPEDEGGLYTGMFTPCLALFDLYALF